MVGMEWTIWDDPKPITNTFNPMCPSHPIIPLEWDNQYRLMHMTQYVITLYESIANQKLLQN